MSEANFWGFAAGSPKSRRFAAARIVAKRRLMIISRKQYIESFALCERHIERRSRISNRGRISERGISIVSLSICFFAETRYMRLHLIRYMLALLAFDMFACANIITLNSQFSLFRYSPSLDKSNSSSHFRAVSHTPRRHFSSNGLCSPAFSKSCVKVLLPPCFAYAI